MPLPSSAMVTVKQGVPGSVCMPAGRSAVAETAMRTREAPARRLFCRASVKMSASVPP